MNSVAEHRRAVPTDSEAILNALPNPVMLVVPTENRRRQYCRRILLRNFDPVPEAAVPERTVPFGSPLLALIDQVRSSVSPVNEYKVDLGTPRIGGDRQVDLHVAPLTERPGHIVVMSRSAPSPTRWTGN